MANIGELLSGGFLGWAVQKLLEGWDYARIAVGVRRNNPDTTGSTISALVKRAESSIGAGQFLQASPGATQLGMAAIPVDPAVKSRHGVEPGRITYRAAVLVTDSDGNERYVTTFITSNSPLSADQVREAAAQDVTSEGFTERIFNRYKVVDEPPTVDVSIISVVRSY